jgi:hypothetical protein
VRLVGFPGGIVAPRIVLAEFALNKVIAQLRYGDWERTSLQKKVRTMGVQSWLRTLPLAKSSCAKIRGLLTSAPLHDLAARENVSNRRKEVQNRCRSAPFSTLVGFSEIRATLLE